MHASTSLSTGHTCAHCGSSYEITKDDLNFYEKISPVFGGKKFQMPSPTLCPDCRRQRRLCFRNERNLYHRKCDLTGKQIISIYSPETKLCVYEQQEWWSDKWDALAYGKDYDFSRPFFDQYQELLRAVPHMSLVGENNENSDYCNLTANCRNCYLVFESSNNEDCLHGYWLQKCDDCCDVSFSHESRHCYEVENCYNCHSLIESRNCTNCSDSAFLFDCIGCRHCLFCTNIRQKEYCIFNEQCTREEYEKKLKECPLSSATMKAWMQEEFRKFLLKVPHRASQFVNAENCSGDYIQNSHNCFRCYHAHEAEDCRYGEHVWRDSKSNMDVSTVGRNAEQCYECINTGIGAMHDFFCIQCWSGANDLMYCYECFASSDCFGCVGLKRKQYCILNKQYTKEKYEDLVPKIIGHMRKMGEWGEFFPARLSLFGYNETAAQDYRFLEKDDALKHGLHWRDEDREQESYLGPRVDIPDDIKDVGDDICSKILLCEETGKPYKIIPQELQFYRKIGVPIPRKCPDQRHKERMALRNPQHLWKRFCAKCQNPMETTYAPDRPEIVYCESCYLNIVY